MQSLQKNAVVKGVEGVGGGWWVVVGGGVVGERGRGEMLLKNGCTNASQHD